MPARKNKAAFEQSLKKHNQNQVGEPPLVAGPPAKSEERKKLETDIFTLLMKRNRRGP